MKTSTLYFILIIIALVIAFLKACGPLVVKFKVPVEVDITARCNDNGNNNLCEMVENKDY